MQRTKMQNRVRLGLFGGFYVNNFSVKARMNSLKNFILFFQKQFRRDEPKTAADFFVALIYKHISVNKTTSKDGR
jgi:hypothetical protein